MKSLTSARALSLLRQHVFGNVLLVDGCYYVQRQGIPQGSLISSLLCSVHYGALDHVLLARFLARFCALGAAAAAPSQDGIAPCGGGVASALLRLVDDSLSVTTDGTTHAGFLEAMQRGFPQFGCCINASKTRTHCPAAAAAAARLGGAHGAAQPANPADGAGRRFFAWCGSLINVDSCEVQPDYRRRSAVRCFSARPRLPLARALLDRFRAAVKPKLRRLFVDPQLNSTLTVRRNVFHALVYAFTLGLPAMRHAVAAGQLSGLLRCVNELLTFTARVASSNQRACLGLPALRLGRGSTLLESQEVAWLGWKALCAMLPGGLNCATARAARARVRHVESAGSMSGDNLALLGEAAEGRSLVSS